MSKRGFSMLEMMIVLAVVAVLMAVAVPYFSKTKSNARLSEVTKQVVGAVARARSVATSGEASTSWPPGTRAVSAGVRFISPTQFAVYVDQNNILDGNEADVQVYDIALHDPSNTLQLATTAVGGDIRLRREGTLAANGAVDVTITDTASGRVSTVRVSLGGLAKIQ